MACATHTKWHLFRCRGRLYIPRCVCEYATKHRFLIMRLLACPIYGNHSSPRGWKTQDAGKREAKAEERSIPHCETRSVSYLLFIDLMMQEKHLKLALNWRNTSSVFFSPQGQEGAEKKLEQTETNHRSTIKLLIHITNLHGNIIKFQVEWGSQQNRYCQGLVWVGFVKLL